MLRLSSLLSLIILLSQTTTFAFRTGSSLIKTGMTLSQVKDTHERITTAYHHYHSGFDHMILVYKGQTLDDILIESTRPS